MRWLKSVMNKYRVSPTFNGVLVIGDKSFMPGQIFESYNIDVKSISICLNKGYISLLYTCPSPLTPSLPSAQRVYERDYYDF